jgi:hypothetical protein
MGEFNRKGTKPSALNADLDEALVDDVSREMENFYSQQLEKAQTDRDLNTANNTMLQVRSDKQLTVEAKERLEKQHRAFIASLPWTDKIPDSFEEVEQELLGLGMAGAHLYILFAKRAEKVQKNKWYLLRGYKTFSEYCEAVLHVSYRTAKQYMDVVGVFPEPILLEAGSAEISKLQAAVPAMRKIDAAGRAKAAKIIVDETQRRTLSSFREYIKTDFREVLGLPADAKRKADPGEAALTKGYNLRSDIKDFGDKLLAKIIEFNPDVSAEDVAAIQDAINKAVLPSKPIFNR